MTAVPARSAPVSTDDTPVCLGVIVGARGLRGEVRIKSFTADPADVAAYGPLSDRAGVRRFALRITGQAKGVMVGRIDGVDDRDAAEALKGVELFVPRHVLPRTDGDEYYHADMVGLAAETMAGEALGRVAAVHDFGAGDVIEIAGGDHGTVMVPFTRAAVPTVDLAAGRLVVDPPEGLLDRATPEPANDTGGSDDDGGAGR